MKTPRITLDQWTALICVVESGSYARAAERLHKSQSTVSYAIRQIQRVSGVEAFRQEGRRAVLTDGGRALYRRAKRLVEEAEGVEQFAGNLASGWESEVRIAADVIFPTWLLMQCVAQLDEETPRISVQLFETVLNGTHEALLDGRADLGIGPFIPQGFLGEALTQIRFVPVAHPAHALHRLGRDIDIDDLRRHRRLVVRESGLGQELRPELDGDLRFTMSHKATSIRAASLGLGYAWYPEDSIRSELDSGELRVLPVGSRAYRYATVYMMFARESAGPATRRLAELIRTSVAEDCVDGTSGSKV